jgi:hypothetical protein
LVAGSAGVGKTRLMREVMEAVPDCQVERVTATESARTLPFGAVAHLLPDDLASIERVDLLAVIGRHLVHRAEGRPLVVAVASASSILRSDSSWSCWRSENRCSFLERLRSPPTFPCPFWNGGVW